MNRVPIILTVAALAVLVFAAPASARFVSLSQAQAIGVADSYGQNTANVNTWADWWDDGCDRQTPWRFTCHVELWTDDETRDCLRYFDVVSPSWVSRWATVRLRTENWTAWRC